MVTVIRERDNFAFVHIPKCGGTSIRASLEALFPDRGPPDHWLYGGIEPHPVLGRIMPAHMPLAVLADHFPQILVQLQQVRSFALVRAPLSRFASSMAQHLRQFHGVMLNDLTTEETKQHLDRVFGALSHAPDWPGVEYVHFLRQTDFVGLRGDQLVDDVFPIENINGLTVEMGKYIGQTLPSPGHENATIHNPTAALSAAKAIGGVLRRFVPERIYGRTRRMLEQRLGRPTLTDRYRAHRLSELPAVRDFVAEFYAADAVLHQNALAQNGPGPRPRNP